MKRILFAFLVITLLASAMPPTLHAESTRKERRLIMKGNDLYKNRKYVEAQSMYQQALVENGNSAEARYNLGLSQIRQIVNPEDTTAKNREITDNARKNFSEVASLAKTKPGLAAKANFNLGNIEFKAKEYQKAIDYYKQALRIDPNDDKARKNLRIAQLNLQKQDQNKNQNQNQDKEENKDQQQNQNQNQNQDKQDNKENQPQQNNLSPQAASQILQAVDNKENQTRARVNRANKGDKTVGNGHNQRKW